MAQKGISPMVDEKHHQMLEALIARLDQTGLTEERRENIKRAVRLAKTWAQLADVLESVITFKPCEDMIAAATGEGLHFGNKYRVSSLKEHVRCSRMMPQAPLVYHEVERRLSRQIPHTASVMF